MHGATGRVEDTDLAGRVIGQRPWRSDWSRDEVASAVLARPGHLLGADGAVGAFEGADRSLGGLWGKIPVTALAARPEVEDSHAVNYLTRATECP